jgi:hypothetical protein
VKVTWIQLSKLFQGNKFWTQNRLNMKYNAYNMSFQTWSLVFNKCRTKQKSTVNWIQVIFLKRNLITFFLKHFLTVTEFWINLCFIKRGLALNNGGWIVWFHLKQFFATWFAFRRFFLIFKTFKTQQIKDQDFTYDSAILICLFQFTDKILDQHTGYSSPLQ